MLLKSLYCFLLMAIGINLYIIFSSLVFLSFINSFKRKDYGHDFKMHLCS